LKKTGFEVETEITVECVKKDLRIVEVPITYLTRVSGAALNFDLSGMAFVSLLQYIFLQRHIILCFISI